VKEAFDPLDCLEVYSDVPKLQVRAGLLFRNYGLDWTNISKTVSKRVSTSTGYVISFV
jgi:hypothetical protein